MTDKELRHLKRSDLIEIIYELQTQNKEASDRIDLLERELNDRRIKISEAGSIAEAALRLNGVFEAAQAAADRYLMSVKAAYTDCGKETASDTVPTTDTTDAEDIK